MQNIINYDDKTALYENPNIPDENKVNASDMNEIKSIVNGSLQGTNAMGSIVVDDINCKNIFDGILEQGTYNASTGEKQAGSTLYRNANPIPVKPNTNYVFSINGTAQRYVLFFYDINNGFMSSNVTGDGKFTTPNNCYYICIRCYGDDYTSSFASLKVQLEAGNTATTYTPYMQPVKKTSVGVKEDTTFYANDFKCRNIYDGLYELGAYNTTTGQKETNNLCYRNVMPIAVKPLTNYVFSLNGTKITETGRIFYLDANGSMLSTETFTGTFTTPANCYYVNWHSTALKTDYPSGLSNTQIEPGSEATPYTPYKNFENEEIYSTNEMVIGRWIDGKPLYRKVIDIGALPNNTTKYVNHNVSNIDIVTNYYGACKSSSNIHFKLPYTSVTATGSIQVYCTNTQITVQTDADRSGYNGYIVIEYTKTTD